MDRVRVLTLNLWGEQPPLDKRMDILVAGARELAPDVIALQEVRQIPGKLVNQAAMLAERLGYDYVFSYATSWGEGEEGLALLSRLPIASHDALELPHATPTERRIVLGAMLTTEHGDLAVFTTHLNYRLGDGLKREHQVVAINKFISTWTSPLPKILLGDFNATPEHDEIRFLRGQTTLDGQRAVYQDAWARLHPGELGLTWSSQNPYTQRLQWLDVNRRLDYIFVSPMSRDGRGMIHEARMVFDQPDQLASDHFGLLAVVQIAPSVVPQ